MMLAGGRAGLRDTRAICMGCFGLGFGLCMFPRWGRIRLLLIVYRNRCVFLRAVLGSLPQDGDQILLTVSLTDKTFDQKKKSGAKRRVFEGTAMPKSS